MADVPRGRFVWHELNTSDPAGAQAFYTTLVGWDTKTGPIAEMPYTEWVNGGTSVGGVMQLPEETKAAGAPPHWLAYVAVPSVDDTTAQAQSLGSTVMAGPMDIPDVGRIAVLQDPQGAVFAVYTPSGDAPGHDGAPEVGEFSWHELLTTDHAAAFDFYAALFGWVKMDAVEMGPLGTYQTYGRAGEAATGGMMNKPAEHPGPPAWLYYVRVPDVRATVEQVKALGGLVLNGPQEVPDGGLVAQCLDPQGAAFAVHATKAA